MNEYITVSSYGEDSFVEKRSKFIGYAKPVQTEQEAVDFINELRQKHWDATHNVYAYVLREGNTARYSDDGEPQGTAGIPVLDVIKKTGICDVVVVVTRYFGGVLLGTGGLVRAYSNGAKIAIEAAKPVAMRECSVCKIKCSYTAYGKISSLIVSDGGKTDDTVFADNVEILFHIPTDSQSLFSKHLTDLTAGGVTAETIDKRYFMCQ
ncbi:MAG: YigZ family protein [Clostridiales bacterium]|nr:YigZ family protein [Clostridiales bacterium]